MLIDNCKILCLILVFGSLQCFSLDTIDKDRKIFKNQAKSLIDWDNINTQQWLDLDSWITQRNAKSANPNWKVEKRVKEHKEVMGKVLQCLGECKVHGRFGATKGRFKTRIYEGDELETFDKSSAWIVLVDGSLIRLAAFSSISFYEINFTKKESFISYRLNRGHLFSSSRKEHDEYETNMLQTDTAFFPLHYIEANQEFYMRKEYKKLNPEEKLKYALELNPGSSSLQIALNKSFKAHPQKKQTTHLAITANSSFIILDGQYHLFHETKAKSLLHADRAKQIDVSLRGYSNNTLVNASAKKYYEVNKEGTQISENEKLKSKFKKIKYLVSRIPSLYMAREIELKDKMAILMNEDIKLSLDFNYYRWEEDHLDKHIDSLIDYSRRIETTNLSVVGKFFKSTVITGMTDKYFQYTYSIHLGNLGNRDYAELEKIKSFDKARYYLWVMKNGKKFISSSFRK
jgi:hypothetical protein